MVLAPLTQPLLLSPSQVKATKLIATKKSEGVLSEAAQAAKLPTTHGKFVWMVYPVFLCLSHCPDCSL